MTDGPGGRLSEVARALGIGHGARHIFVCVDQTKPKCAPREQTIEVWAYLKRRLRELGLEGKVTADTGAPCVHRSRVDCLRICAEGPIAVVYPEGTWYRGVDVQVMERILQEHLVGGRPVTSHVITTDPLGGSGAPAAPAVR